MIALGAVKVTLKKMELLKRFSRDLKYTFLPKNNIGHVVTDLTGITSDLLVKEGYSFPEALGLFRKIRWFKLFEIKVYYLWKS